MTTATDARTVQLKRVRLSFSETLVEKGASVDGGPEKFGTNLLIEAGQPNNEENKAKCMAAVKAAGEQAWGKPDTWKGLLEDNPKRLCYRPGSRFKSQETGEVYKGYDGNMAISCSTPAKGQKRPKIMDRRKKVITDPAEIGEVAYSGSYCDAILSFYGTDKGGKGIFCVVEGIRSHEEGDRTGGGGVNVTEDMFEDMEPTDSFSGGGDDDDMIG